MTIKGKGLPSVAETAQTQTVESGKNKPLQQPSQAPPEVPVPSAKGQTGVVVGSGVEQKRDGELRKVLATLAEQISAAPDAAGVEKALTKAKNAAPREDVKAALSALAAGLGDHADFVAIVFEHMKTDHFDHAKATLKTVAKELGVKLGGGSAVDRAYADVRGRIQGGFADYRQELGQFDAARDLTKIVAEPESQALESLLHFGATDLDEAAAWLSELKNGNDVSAQIREACNERLQHVADVDRDLATDLKDVRPARGLAMLLSRYPMLAPDVLVSLGFPKGTEFPPDERATRQADPGGKTFAHALKAYEDANAVHYADWIRNGVVTLAGFVPFTAVGVATSGANGLYEVREAVVAARAARVSAAAGLVTRAQAERLDNEILGTAMMAFFSTALSAIPGGSKLAAEALKKGGLAKGLQAVGKFAVDHPSAFAVLTGAMNAGMQTELRTALRDQDYGRAGLLLACGALESLVLSSGIRTLQKYGPALRAKLLKLNVEAPNKPINSQKPMAEDKSVTQFLRDQTAHGNGTYDKRVVGSVANAGLKLPRGPGN